MLFNLMYITKVNKNNAGVNITFVISNLRLWKYTAGSKWYQFPISSNEETGQGANLDFLKYLKNSSFFYICQLTLLQNSQDDTLTQITNAFPHINQYI